MRAGIITLSELNKPRYPGYRWTDWTGKYHLCGDAVGEHQRLITKFHTLRQNVGELVKISSHCRDLVDTHLQRIAKREVMIFEQETTAEFDRIRSHAVRCLQTMQRTQELLGESDAGQVYMGIESAGVYPPDLFEAGAGI